MLEILRGPGRPSGESVFKGLLSAALAVAGLSVLSQPAAAVKKLPVACSEITELRTLGASDLNLVTNRRTGDSVQYTVIGDGASGKKHIIGHKATDAKVLVFFPGTDYTLPDWPVQMLTNSTYSPGIKKTDAYRRSQDGKISLCHEYYIVLFDYPGIGNSSFSGDLTGDRVANNVDAMLDDAEKVYGIKAKSVTVVGWSLGTLYGLKYAFLSPAAKTGRAIDDVILFSSKPGGNTDNTPNGNAAQCTTELFAAAESTTISDTFRDRLQIASYKLTFPYLGQKPYNDANNGGCTAQVDTTAETFSVSVQYDCKSGSECRSAIAVKTANEKTSPWSKTDGIPQDLYIQERNYVPDWNFCHCATAGNDYDSQDCTCSSTYTDLTAKENGGLCKTASLKANRPVSGECAQLNISGTLVDIHGQEDLFIQWRYGRELIRAYQRQYGKASAQYIQFPAARGKAGHGLLLQHPKWAQKKVYGVISAN